jgi:hypothetical protein
LAAISEIRVGMGVFSANDSRIGTVYVIDEDRLTMLGDPDSAYADGHYRVAIVLVAGVDEGRIVLSKDAEAAVILEAYSETGQGAADRGAHSDGRGTAGAATGGEFGSLAGRRGSTLERSGSGTAIAAGFTIICIVALAAIPFFLRGRERAETRPQRAGEAATTRYGMEEGDNTDIPATGGPDSWDDPPARNP